MVWVLMDPNAAAAKVSSLLPEIYFWHISINMRHITPVYKKNTLLVYWCNMPHIFVRGLSGIHVEVEGKGNFCG